MSGPRPILIVEDDATLRATIAEQISLDGEFRADEAESARCRLASGRPLRARQGACRAHTSSSGALARAILRVRGS